MSPVLNPGNGGKTAGARGIRLHATIRMTIVTVGRVRQQQAAMRVKVLRQKAYWDLRQPFDKYLPDSVSSDEVVAELEAIQSRFRECLSRLGDEGTDWEFPGHYQHVRVFYVYLQSSSLYTPDLATAVAKSIEGFDSWICELECYKVPNMPRPGMITPAFLNGDFYMEEDDAPEHFAAALDLPIDRSAAPRTFWRRLFHR